MKIQILYLLIAILIILTSQKEKIEDKIISEIYVKNYKKLKLDLDSNYISEIEKLNIPSEYKDWVKNVNLDKKESKNELIVKYTNEKGGYGVGKFSSIRKIGKKKQKVYFKYGSVETSLRPINDNNLNEEKVKKIVEKIMKNEIKKKLSNKDNNKDLIEKNKSFKDENKSKNKKKKISKYDIDDDGNNNNDDIDDEDINKKKKIKKIRYKRKKKNEDDEKLSDKKKNKIKKRKTKEKNSEENEKKKKEKNKKEKK